MVLQRLAWDGFPEGLCLKYRSNLCFLIAPVWPGNPAKIYITQTPPPNLLLVIPVNIIFVFISFCK